MRAPRGPDSLALWVAGFDKGPEVCTDQACPLWAPGEFARRYGPGVPT